jgi:hypothetical protein
MSRVLLACDDGTRKRGSNPPKPAWVGSSGGAALHSTPRLHVNLRTSKANPALRFQPQLLPQCKLAHVSLRCAARRYEVEREEALY